MVLLGQIGTGSWGIKLLNTMNSLASVKSCYGHQNKDLVPRNVEVVHDAGEIILDDELDGIVIASPPETHFELARKCLKASQNVFVEKPMCQDSKEAQLLFDMAQTNKLKLMVGFVYLYSNEYGRIKETAINTNNISANFMKKTRTHRMPCMVDFGSHFVALALDFYERAPKAVKLNGDHDDAVVDMNFGDKRAIVHASYKSESRRDVTFMRDRRTIYSWNVMDMDLKTDNPLIEECKDWVRYLQCDVEPKANASLGVKVVKLVGGMLP